MIGCLLLTVDGSDWRRSAICIGKWSELSVVSVCHDMTDVSREADAMLMSGDVGLPFFGIRVGMFSFNTPYVVLPISSAMSDPRLWPSSPSENHIGSCALMSPSKMMSSGCNRCAIDAL